jgi:hypothetical protein
MFFLITRFTLLYFTLWMKKIIFGFLYVCNDYKRKTYSQGTDILA